MRLSLPFSAALVLAGLLLGRPDLAPSGSVRAAAGSGRPPAPAAPSESERLSRALLELTGAAPLPLSLPPGRAHPAFLARELAARRCGTTWEAVRRVESEASWLRLGLVEWLARRLPVAAGLSRRDWAADLEYAWVSDPELRRLDVRAPDPAARQLWPLASAARVHALLGRLERERPLREHLARLAAAGPDAARDGALGKLCAELAGPRAELGFEQAWRLRLAAGPEGGPEAGEPVAELLTVVFAAATEAEPCRCRIRPEGGVARLAAALGRWRAEDPELLFLHLGDVFPPDADHPRPEQEARLVLKALARAGCAALALGPRELRRGGLPPALEAELRGAAVVAWGGSAEAGAPPREVVLERRGRRLGIVGWSEDVAAGLDPPPEPGPPFDAGGLERGLGHLRELRRRVDLLIVGGRFRPATLRALTDPSLGVDLVLAAGYLETAEGARSAGFLGRTAVVQDRLGRTGLNRVELALSASGRVLLARHEELALTLALPVDPEVQAWIDAERRERAGGS